MPAVNPDILKWARETAGLTLDAAADKLGITTARNLPPSDRLAAYERGDKAPSRPLLLKMAKAYRRSLLTFYLSAPPRKGDRGEDFRSLPNQHTADEPLVDALPRHPSPANGDRTAACPTSATASAFRWVDTFGMLRALDFRTGWQRTH